MKRTPLPVERFPVTAVQADVIRFINGFRDTEQCNPTMAEISAHFKWKSANAAHDVCATLMRKGLLVKNVRAERGATL